MFAKKTDAKTDVEPQAQRAPAGPSAAPNGGPAYGIDDAMQLMRSLPTDQNIDLVVRVVRVTLASLDVRFEDIIADATRKQKQIQDNITALRAHVTDLEKQLEVKRREIAVQDAAYKETTSVKERLYLADKSSARHRKPTPADVPIQAAAAPSGRAKLPRPEPRDESGEMPEILSAVNVDDLTAPTASRNR